MIFKIRKQRDWDSVREYISKLPENKSYDVNIKLKRKIRNLSQNALYWLWLTCIMAETGNDKDYLHEYFKESYLPKDRRVVFGKPVEIAVSTTSLDTKQFTHYLDRIQQFASAELGIVLPDPNDKHWQEFYETYKDFV